MQIQNDVLCLYCDEDRNCKTVFLENHELVKKALDHDGYTDAIVKLSDTSFLLLSFHVDADRTDDKIEIPNEIGEIIENATCETGLIHETFDIFWKRRQEDYKNNPPRTICLYNFGEFKGNDRLKRAYLASKKALPTCTEFEKLVSCYLSMLLSERQGAISEGMWIFATDKATFGHILEHFEQRIPFATRAMHIARYIIDAIEESQRAPTEALRPGQ